MNCLRILCGLVLLNLALTSAGFAQAWGTILGTVKDPSGGAVPSAHVKLTETQTSLARTTVTNTQGGYVVPALRPTQYTLSVEAPGFQNFVQKGIVLEANQSLTVNVKLILGATHQAVTVEAAAVQVNTSTPTLNQVVDERRMLELPLNGRNAATLTTLVAGAVTAPNAGAIVPFTVPGVVTISTNGAFQNQTNYQLDGANNNDLLTNVSMPFPFPDALQEFSVQTSNYSAQYGENAGGMVNIVTKSGTNELHGDGFEFVRNAVFNSRNFFAAQRDQLKRNQFGGTIGGPVVIPGAYNGRDRTFFFFGYQGTRLSNTQNGLTSFLPTPAMVSGDFSAFLQADNPANPLHRVVQIKNPSTGKPAPGNLLSPSIFDPAAVKVLQYLPLSEEAPSGQVFFSAPMKQSINDYVGRLDHSFGDKDKLTIREYFARYSSPAVFEPGNLLNMSSSTEDATNNILLHETHIFSPNLLNEFRVAYARVATGGSPPNGSPGVNDFGVNLAQQSSPSNIDQFVVNGFFTFRSLPYSRDVRNSYNYSDDVSWVAGRHTVTFGGSYERAQAMVHFNYPQSGRFIFNGLFTGTAISDFLTGKVFTFQQGAGQYLDAFNNFIGLYAQDQFRVTHRLALNYGVRYEPYFPWHDQLGRIQQFRLGDYYAGMKSQVFINAPPGMFFPGDPGMPENGTRGSYGNFAPRAGFAYDLRGNGRTSIRGGAGMFYDSHTIGASLFPSAQQSPWEPLLTFTPPPGPLSNPLQGIASPFPSLFPPPADFVFPPFSSVTTFDPTTSFQVPVTYSWNFTIEHQLASNWLVRAAYVGVHASHIAETVELNPAVYIPGSKLSIDQRRALQPFGSISMDSQSINTSYNSLQLTLQKRFSRGLSVLANYTYSKSLDDLPVGALVRQGPGGSGSASPIPWNMAGRHQFDRGPSVFDHTHILAVSYVWDLPKWSGAGPVVRHVFGNWELSGIVSARSGDPVTILAAGNPSQTGLGGERAVQVGNPFGAKACGNSAPCVNDLNPSSFQLPATGTVGTLGKGTVRGPGFFNWDMGIFKNIPLSERCRLQFRAEFFNIFNRTNFDDPHSTLGAAGFGSILGSADPRIGQLALKILF
jgi:Carboxypeptidase regulatory-like domain